MDPLKSKGVVRRILKEDGILLVSFRNHDGYFRLSDPAKIAQLKEQEEISFTFDRDLNILQIMRD